MRSWTVVAGAVLFLTSSASGQAPLPVIEQGDAAALRVNGERLLAALKALDAPFPPETERALRDTLADRLLDPQSFIEKVQKLLDPHCLVGVTVNPESRVKVARGPASAELVQDQWKVLLIKVHNEAGVTQPLGVTSPQIRLLTPPSPPSDGGEKKVRGEGWLDALVYNRPLIPEKLSGHEIEYVIVRLRSNETGKREARLSFDVGQGTQDLGFRAEVPVLFTIKPK